MKSKLKRLGMDANSYMWEIEHKIKVKILFEPRDMWVGLYWKYYGDIFPGRTTYHCHRFRVWICIVPMFPIRLTFDRDAMR